LAQKVNKIDKYFMIDSLFNLLLKRHVDKLVDQRFEENMIERYREQQQQQLRERIERVRETLSDQTPGVSRSEPPPARLQPSSNVSAGSTKPELQAETNPTLIKQKQLADMKAKLSKKKK
jgi:hypothetical protein|tara:strand:+ start:224 stop:583 length:360 start_codon:yes stop_codon:yes gene_type:complete